MILAVDCREFVPGRMTGIGRFLQGLLAEIARSRPHLTTVALAPPEAPMPVSAPHIQVRRLPRCPTLYWDQVLLPRALRRLRATAFFSPYYKAPLCAPCPTVVTIHDLIPLRFPAYTRGPWRLYAAAFRAWAELLAKRAATVVTDSEYSKTELVRALGLTPTRVHALPIGVADEFRPMPVSDMTAAMAARYGISKKYVLCVSNFLPHKNLHRLMEAFCSLPENIRGSTELVLAGAPGGHGPARPISRTALDRPGVIIPGSIADEDLPIIYAGATALVCPSLTEGFGLPVLEAMACGTPVLCARAGALPEVAGDAALYVDPLSTSDIAGGLRRILEDAPLRYELAARGLVRAGLFEARKTTARLVDLLETISAS